MAEEVIRRPDFASGALTPEEKKLMEAHTQKWIGYAMNTGHIQPDKIIPAIEGLYSSAGLPVVRVLIVPSPLVMAVSAAFASAINWRRKNPDARADATEVSNVVV